MGYISSFFYRIIRRHTTRIPEEKALKWKTRLSVAYMLIAWNLFGYTLYMMSSGRADWPKYYGLKTDEEADKKSNLYFAELLGIEKARLMRYSGFTKVEDYMYEKPKPPSSEPADSSDATPSDQ